MKKTEYLFGFKPEILDGMEYWEALRLKIESGEILYSNLQMNESDGFRKFWVRKAIDKTRNLLEERDEY